VKENINVIQNHISNCAKITSTLLNILSRKLNITDPDLPSLHEFMRPAGNQMRLIKSNPGTNPLVAGAHTDFGSLTVLFNNIGGLQVLLSPEQGWLWVPPVEGCAIINLGDSIVRFTDGLFRSATHRVVQPPVEQGGVDRYSVVYFERPNDDVKLRPLTKDAGSLDDYPTAREWIERRVLGGKKNHYKGEDGYKAGRGTETTGE
jgi:isopenicillin N synthase-like dioxygenase